MKTKLLIFFCMSVNLVLAQSKSNRIFIVKINPAAYLIKEYNLSTEVGITQQLRCTASAFKEKNYPKGLENLFDFSSLGFITSQDLNGASARLGVKYLLTPQKQWLWYLEPQFRFGSVSGVEKSVDITNLNITNTIDKTVKAQTKQAVLLVGTQLMFKKIPLVIDFNLGVGYINTNYRSIITATTDGLDVGRKDNQNFNGMDLYLGTSIGFDLSKIKLIE